MKDWYVNSIGGRRTLEQSEDFSAEGLSWVSVAKTISQMMAEDWFSDLGLISMADEVGTKLADIQIAELLTPFLNPDSPTKIIPGLLRQEADFGRRKKMEDSQLGRLLIEALGQLGVNWHFHAIRADTQGSITEDASGEIGMASWRSFLGTQVHELFSIYEKDGQEYCYWHMPMFIANRAFEHIAERELLDEHDEVLVSVIVPEAIMNGALTYGQWSTGMYIPRLAQTLFYLCETPFPSSFLSLSRQMAFGELDARQLPVPRLRYRRQAFALGSDSDGEYNGGVFPAVIDAGWIFSANTISEIMQILQVICDGLVRFSTYVEDGFLNFDDPDFGFAWSPVTLSACTFDSQYIDGQSHVGKPYWFPGSLVGVLAAESSKRLARASDLRKAGNLQEAMEDTVWLAMDGVGFPAASAINTLVFSEISPDPEFVPQLEEMLDAAVRLDVINESTNALSNWGILMFNLGRLDEAILKFNEALRREDQYAEAEASHYLAKIYERNGNQQLAQEYEARCARAGGYS